MFNQSVFYHLFTMKVILAFALFIAVASAVPTCEQKNVVLKDALVNLAKRQMAQAGKLIS